MSPVLILFLISSGLLLVRLFVAFYNYNSKPLLSLRFPGEHNLNSGQPFLSILVPARNEEENMPVLIESILAQSYKNFELLILDDGSSDRTRDIVTDFSNRYPEVKLIEGKELPEGWLGKNWACDQLSQQAKGEFLLFIDADVSVKSDALVKSVLAIKKYRLALFSLFPEQIMATNGEKLTVPLMHYILLSLLPLEAVFLFSPPSLAAANGQYMLFSSREYLSLRFHRICKNEILEDVRIMQHVKRNGLKGMTLLGNDLVYCRMYRSWKEGVNGFSKNFLAGFGDSRFGLLLFLAVTLLIPVVTLFVFPLAAIGYFVLALILRAVICKTCEQDVWEGLLYHPGQMVTLLIISYKSLLGSFYKKLEWKGRKIG